VLYITLLGRPAAIETGSVAPFGFQFDSIRRIGDHDPRLAFSEQSGNGLRACCVPTQDSMLPAQPQVTSPRRRILGSRRSVIFVRVLRLSQQEFIDFVSIETGEVDIVV